MPQNKKIIVFENLRPIHLPFVLVYNLVGFSVMYLETTLDFHHNESLKKLKNNLKLEKVLPNGVNFEAEISGHAPTLAAADAIYEQRFKELGVIKNLRMRLNSDLTHSVYKKSLVYHLYDYFRVDIILKAFIKEHDLSSVNFFPESHLVYLKWIKKAEKNIQQPYDFSFSQINIPFEAQIFSYLIHFIERLKWLGGFFLTPLWIFSKIRRITWRDPNKQKYQVGIRVYNDDWAYQYKYRTIDFLLDGKKLHKDNTLFCVETKLDKDYREQLRSRDYHIADLPKVLSSVSFSFFTHRLMGDFLSLWFTSLWSVLFCETFITKETMKSIYTYLSWRRFLDLYHVEHYVVYNDRGPQHIVRNIILDQSKVKTWIYVHSCHSEDLFETSQQQTFLNTQFSYLFYDEVACWGNKLEEFYLSHPTHIKNFNKLGCLWSEHVQQIKENKELSDLYSQILGSDSGSRKIISVFDTTFWNAVLDSDEMVLFIEGIADLVYEWPDLEIYLKRKWSVRDMMIDQVSHYESIYTQFESHPRCYVLDADGSDAAEAIAISDLVISACFTSPTIETLGVRKKGIYFDPNARFRGAYYDQFPKFVAHSKEELKNFVRYWLYETTDHDFEEWLNSFIKGEIDSAVDGKAITRFRELLHGG